MKILVIGDYCMDEFVYCSCDRLSPEAPVPVAVPMEKETNDGMAGNVYNNLKSLNPNIQIDLIRSLDPIVKTRYIDKESKQTLLRVDSHDFVGFSAKVEDIREEYDAIVIADYDKGFITETFLADLDLYFPNTTLYLDTKKIIGAWGSGYHIKINASEYEQGLKYGPIPHQELVVTLGSEGCMWMSGDIKKTYPSCDVEVLEVSGAGDTFMAAWVTANTIDVLPLKEALEFANKAAAEAVKHVGVVSVKREWIK